MQIAPVIAWRRVLVTVLQLVILGSLLSFYWVVAKIQVSLPYGTDYAKFYYSAHQALHQQPLYTVVDSALFGVPEAVFYRSSLVQDPPLHMPQVMAANMPLALLPFPVSYWVWFALSLAAGLGGCAICWRMLYGSHANWRVLLWMWIAFLGFFPTFTALRLGQAALVFFLLAALVWQATANGHTRRAGIALGLAVSLRSFGALLLFYFLLKRQWRLLLWSSATYTATILASLPLVGVDAYRDWLNVMGGVAIQGRNWNASLWGFFARILPPEPVLLVTAACSLFWLALLAWLSRPPHGARLGSRRDELTFSLALALMLLLSPLGWMYYFPILFVGVFVIWRQTADDRLQRLRWALLPAWLLSNVPTMQHQVAEMADPLGWWTWNSVYCYALLIFSGLLAYLAAQSKGWDEKARG